MVAITYRYSMFFSCDSLPSLVDFVDVIIPTVVEPSESIPDKIAELNAFINVRPHMYRVDKS
jgi:hypothetical protein